MVDFLKTGSAAQQAHAQAEQQQAAQKALSANRRFWMKSNTETKVTFLDGHLDADGRLIAPTFWEHNLKIQNKFGNHFVCTQEFEACPICAMGDKPYLVVMMSIIDHSAYTDRNGKEWVHQRRLFGIKREAFLLLQNKAAKRDGIAGWLVGISRVGEMSSNVGNDFDFEAQYTPEQLVQMYGENAQPVNYAEAIPYRTAAQLTQEFGFGAGVMPAPAVGHAQPMGHPVPAAAPPAAPIAPPMAAPPAAAIPAAPAPPAIPAAPVAAAPAPPAPPAAVPAAPMNAMPPAPVTAPGAVTMPAPPAPPAAPGNPVVGQPPPMPAPLVEAYAQEADAVAAPPLGFPQDDVANQL